VPNIRTQVIRLASSFPDGSRERRALLDALRTAADEEEPEGGSGGAKPSGKFLEFLKEEGDRKVRNPDTGNDVKIKSLKGPKGKELAHELFEKWLAVQDSKGKGKEDSKGKGKEDSKGKGKEDSKGKGKEDSKGKPKEDSKGKGKDQGFMDKGLIESWGNHRSTHALSVSTEESRALHRVRAAPFGHAKIEDGDYEKALGAVQRWVEREEKAGRKPDATIRKVLKALKSRTAAAGTQTYEDYVRATRSASRASS
jgi:hypothetical protein